MAIKTDLRSRDAGVLVGSLLAGAVSGAIAGYIVSIAIQSPSGDMSSRAPTSTTAQSPGMATSTAPTSTLALIPLERRSAVSLVPPTFLKRRMSSVASLYRRPRGSEDKSLGSDRLLGQAVAMTSDGWFATAASVFDDLNPADVVLWHDGASYAVERGVVDGLSGAAFIKIAVSDLTPPAFSRAQELGPGTELWTEARPGEFSSSPALSPMARVSPNESVSSEQAMRRVSIAGVALRGDLGGAAWDPNGSLVGIIDGKDGERLRLIPASNIASSFSSLLVSGRVTHAYLGVRAVDLASQRSDAPRESLPLTGALLRDAKGGKLAVQRDSPAAKAGLKAGDVILRVERDILDGTADLGELLADYRPGTQVTLRVWRNGQDLDVPVVLGEVVTGEVLK